MYSQQYMNETYLQKLCSKQTLWTSFLTIKCIKCTVVAKLFWWCNLFPWVSCRNTILRNSLMAIELPFTATFFKLSCVNLRSSKLASGSLFQYLSVLIVELLNISQCEIMIFQKCLFFFNFLKPLWGCKT